MTAPLAVILAGGMGTRIRHLLPDLPKPLAPVAGRPFLEWVILYLSRQGMRRVVLSTGHRAPAVESFAARLTVPGVSVSCAEEPEPLGTAGGFLNAVEHGGNAANDFLVCNGDSLVLTALEPLFAALRTPAVDAALLAVNVPDASRFGTVDAGPDGMLRGFAEKRPGAGSINGGVYLLKRPCIGGFPRKRPLSFEYDVFPALLAGGTGIKVVSCDAPFLDIGTEASLAQADGFIRNNMRWFQ